MKNAFLNVAPCGSYKNRRFGGTCRLHVRCESLKSYIDLKCFHYGVSLQLRVYNDKKLLLFFETLHSEYVSFNGCSM
jgi:hypothetical protein